MRKLVLLLLLGTAARADWTRVEGNDELDAYVDPATIRRQANLVEVWALLDYKSAHQWSDYLVYRSTKTHKEYDCASGHYRTLDSAFHFDHMGAGQSIFSVPSGTSWRPVLPDSVEAMLQQFACRQ